MSTRNGAGGRAPTRGVMVARDDGSRVTMVRVEGENAAEFYLEWQEFTEDLVEVRAAFGIVPGTHKFIQRRNPYPGDPAAAWSRLMRETADVGNTAHVLFVDERDGWLLDTFVRFGFSNDAAFPLTWPRSPGRGAALLLGLHRAYLADVAGERELAASIRGPILATRAYPHDDQVDGGDA